MRIGRNAMLVAVIATVLPVATAAKPCSPPHAVYGLIGAKWNSMGGSDGPLGCPITEEMDHPEGKGRYQRFEFGEMAWSPNTGPNSVQAAYLVDNGITVEWGDTAPFHYDTFIVRWDKDGQNIGQQDVGSGSTGKWTIPYSGIGRYRIVVEGCDRHTLSSSTCRQGWTNPVYVSFTGAVGKATSLTQPPFDLVTRAADPAGIPLNPVWAAQANTPGSIPNADATCFDHVNGNLVPRFDRCTSQRTYRDTASNPGPHSATCAVGGSSPIHGHVNWWVATYEGTVSWKSYEWPDEDYNFLLYRRDSALVTTGNAQPKDNPSAGTSSFDNLLQLKAEFDADETIEHFQTPFWSSLRAAAEESDEAAHRMLDGKEAIAIGLVGLDCVHDCGSELHPLFAIAIHVGGSEQDDVWAIFVRNWGNEGWCSEYRHLFQQQDFVFHLPWRSGMVGLTVLNQNGDGTFLTNNGQVTGPSVTWAAGQGVNVAFHLPPPSEGARTNGELHLQWIKLGDPNRAARPKSSAPNFNGGMPIQRRKVTTMSRATSDEPLHDLVAHMPPQQQQAFRAARLPHPEYDSVRPRINSANIPRLSVVTPHVAGITVVRDLEKAARDEKRRQLVCAAYGSRPPGAEAMCRPPAVNPLTRPNIRRNPPPAVAVPPKPTVRKQ